MEYISCLFKSEDAYQGVTLLGILVSLFVFAVLNLLIMMLIIAKNRRLSRERHYPKRKIILSDSKSTTRSQIPLTQYFDTSHEETATCTTHEFNIKDTGLNSESYNANDNPFLPTRDYVFSNEEAISMEKQNDQGNVYDTLKNKTSSSSEVPLINTSDISCNTQDISFLTQTPESNPQVKKLSALGIEIPTDLEVISNIYTVSPPHTYDKLEPKTSQHY